MPRTCPFIGKCGYIVGVKVVGVSGSGCVRKWAGQEVGMSGSRCVRQWVCQAVGVSGSGCVRL